MNQFKLIFFSLVFSLPLPTAVLASPQDYSDSLTQITNVNRLKDVSPTDWAYEALRSLSDRYNCLEGFPDDTYKGSQPLTRYQFAAGLNSCLNQIESLINSGKTISSQDAATLQRLS